MITSGTVSVEDGTKAKEEYAPARKVRVDINFSVPAEAGADIAVTFLDVAAQIAHNKVAELLGRSSTSVQKPVAAKPAKEPAKEIVSSAETSAVTKPSAEKKPAKQAAKTQVSEKTKADLEAEMLASAGKPAEAPMIPDEEEDPLADLLGDTAPVPVTDKELSAAAIAKADKMKAVSGWDAKKIRLLVEKFAGKAGSKFHEVPAEKRHDFLKELEALK